MYNLLIYKHNKKDKNRIKSLKAFQEMRASSQEIRKLSTTLDVGLIFNEMTTASSYAH